MQEGIIIKGVGGLYVVKTESSVYKAKARGKFRLDHTVPMVGDRVGLMISGKEIRIDEIRERKNFLVRPPVANIDQLCIVTAAMSPEPDLFLLDKLTVSALYQNIRVLFCINKTDLKEPNELLDIYRRAGFCVLTTCAKENIGISEVKDKLKGCITAFCGASGVGKSSLLNVLDDRLSCETSHISEKIERGRNTTRHTEIFEIEPESFVFDTPGFSSFDVPLISSRELIQYFPDLYAYTDDCQFSDCSHTKEISCGVNAALERGDIAKSRFESYGKMFEECKNIKEWEKR
jgi:ribosome small subunit-dependent GTPase A